MSTSAATLSQPHAYAIAELSPRVLVIDDDAVAMSELSEMLEFEGLGCIVADTQERALSLLDAFASIKVIVTDFYLRGKSTGADTGLAFVKTVRERFQNRSFEVIVVSGDKNVIVDCAFTGVDKFLAKPIAPESLCSIVRTAVEQASDTQSSRHEDSSNLTLLNLLESQADAIATLTEALNETRNNCRKAQGALDRLCSAASIAHNRLQGGQDQSVDTLFSYIAGQGFALKDMLHVRKKVADAPKVTSISKITV